MPQGKPAGKRCAQLGADESCAVFSSPQRPSFCAGLQPSNEMCGDSREQALAWLAQLELVTSPQI